MTEFDVSIIIAGVIAGAAPIVLAAIGETITEKAGLINLSLDGSILLAAMASFVVALKADSLLAGFVAGALVGAAVAAAVAVFSIFLRQNQVAVGFVLTLMTRDLAYFLGNPYSRLQGPQTAPAPIPGLDQIPFLGPVLFNHPLPVYFSVVLIGICWWYVYRTSPGLKLRAVGENPQAAYARGINPRKVQMLYAVCGGLLVGLAGATFCALHQTRLGAAPGRRRHRLDRARPGHLRRVAPAQGGGRRLPVFISAVDGHLLPGLAALRSGPGVSSGPLPVDDFHPADHVHGPERIRPALGGKARTGRGPAALFVGNGAGGVGQTLSAGLNQRSARHSGSRLRTLKCDEPASILNFWCNPVQLFMTLWKAEFGEEKFGETSWRPALFRRHQVQPKSRPA